MLLTHLYVLIPVFDNFKHYYVGQTLAKKGQKNRLARGREKGGRGRLTDGERHRYKRGVMSDRSGA
jgi:hypothetical protein